ncbi:MAG: YkgJ family cysteine cluster protein [Candidatus Woesearchaeota archaeon]
MKGLSTKENFQCNRHCGQCCKKLTVMISRNEVKQIKNLGYEYKDFLDNDLLYIKKFILKRNRKGCIFLKKNKNGTYSCKIYKNRPKTCIQYPFFGKDKSIGSCLPNKMFPSAFVSFSK